MADLDAFGSETKPIGPEVSRTKIKIFLSSLENLLSRCMLVAKTSVRENFTYFDTVVHDPGLSDQEVSRWIGLAEGRSINNSRSRLQ